MNIYLILLYNTAALHLRCCHPQLMVLHVRGTHSTTTYLWDSPGFIVEQQSSQRKRYSGLESPKINVITCSNYLRVVRMLATLHLLWNPGNGTLHQPCLNIDMCTIKRGKIRNPCKKWCIVLFFSLLYSRSNLHTQCAPRLTNRN